MGANSSSENSNCESAEQGETSTFDALKVGDRVVLSHLEAEFEVDRKGDSEIYVKGNNNFHTDGYVVLKTVNGRASNRALIRTIIGNIIARPMEGPCVKKNQSDGEVSFQIIKQFGTW